MMKLSKRYSIQICAVLLITLYVMSGEVYDRGAALAKKYLQIREKEQSIVAPEEFAARKRALLVEKKELTTMVRRTAYPSHETSGGLFEYLNVNAKLSNIIVRSIVPSEAKAAGSAKDIIFTITISAKYHDAAKFINNIENGAIPISINQAKFQSDPIGNTVLSVVIEAQAHIAGELE
jgi:hypothetical protein